MKITTEYIIFCILFLAVMISGYLDDAAETPWSYSIVYMLSFVNYNSTDIFLFSNVIHVPMSL